MKKKEEYNKIKQYIINPIENGLWETTFSNNPSQPDSFVSYIYNFFQQTQQYNDYIITVLSNMYYIANPPAINQSYNIPDNYNIRIKKIIEKYNIKIIQNNLIIDEEFLFIFQSTNSRKSTILSLSKTLVNNLEKIFEELEYNGTVEKKEKRFSPKAILFQPYFFYVQIISHDLFSSTQDELNYFNRAITAYNSSHHQYSFHNNHQYEESIRMIGKAFESRLTNIYETLLRKDASHLSSIGKLKNSIESEIKNILQITNQQREYTISSISEEIYRKSKSLERTNEQKPQKIINTFKEIAKAIEKQLQHNNDDKVLFPPEIQKELENLLELRNQVSHHNTIQSTQENAISMLFSYIKVYLWWKEVSQHIQNWDGTKKEVIEEFERLKKDNSILKFKSFLEKPIYDITDFVLI